MLIVFFFKWLNQEKLNIDQWTMKLRSRSDEPYQIDTYSLQSFHTTNIVDLLLIVSEKQTKHKNLTPSNEPWKWGQGQIKPAKNIFIHQIKYTYCKQYKKTRPKHRLYYNHWTMKMRSRSDDDCCQLDMYTLQSFHTSNIPDP